MTTTTKLPRAILSQLPEAWQAEAADVAGLLSHLKQAGDVNDYASMWQAYSALAADTELFGNVLYEFSQTHSAMWLMMVSAPEYDDFIEMLKSVKHHKLAPEFTREAAWIATYDDIIFGKPGKRTTREIDDVFDAYNAVRHPGYAERCYEEIDKLMEELTDVPHCLGHYTRALHSRPQRAFLESQYRIADRLFDDLNKGADHLLRDYVASVFTEDSDSPYHTYGRDGILLPLLKRTLLEGNDEAIRLLVSAFPHDHETFNEKIHELIAGGKEDKHMGSLAANLPVRRYTDVECLQMAMRLFAVAPDIISRTSRTYKPQSSDIESLGRFYIDTLLKQIGTDAQNKRLPMDKVVWNCQMRYKNAGDEDKVNAVIADWPSLHVATNAIFSASVTGDKGFTGRPYLNMFWDGRTVKHLRPLLGFKPYLDCEFAEAMSNCAKKWTFDHPDLNEASRSDVKSYIDNEAQLTLSEVNRQYDANKHRLKQSIEPRAFPSTPEEWVAVAEINEALEKMGLGELTPSEKARQVLANTPGSWTEIADRLNANEYHLSGVQNLFQHACTTLVFPALAEAIRDDKVRQSIERDHLLNMRDDLIDDVEEILSRDKSLFDLIELSEAWHKQLYHIHNVVRTIPPEGKWHPIFPQMPITLHDEPYEGWRLTNLTDSEQVARTGQIVDTCVEGMMEEFIEAQQHIVLVEDNHGKPRGYIRLALEGKDKTESAESRYVPIGDSDKRIRLIFDTGYSNTPCLDVHNVKNWMCSNIENQSLDNPDRIEVNTKQLGDAMTEEEASRVTPLLTMIGFDPAAEPDAHQRAFDVYAQPPKTYHWRTPTEDAMPRDVVIEGEVEAEHIDTNAPLKEPYNTPIRAQSAPDLISIHGYPKGLHAGTGSKPVYLIPDEYRVREVAHEAKPTDTIKPQGAALDERGRLAAKYVNVGKPDPIKSDYIGKSVDAFLDQTGLRTKLWQSFQQHCSDIAPEVARQELRKASKMNTEAVAMSA